MSANAPKKLKDHPLLIADSDPASIQYLFGLLKEKSYSNITTADNVDDAKSLLKKNRNEHHPFQLVIICDNLSLTDDKHICSFIREQTDAPILMLSSEPSVENEVSAMVAGASAYLEKKFSTDIFLLKIDHLLSQHVLEFQLKESLKKNQAFYLDTIKMMAKTIEIKTPDTAHHGENVAKYAKAIAIEMGVLLEADIDRLVIAALLHDIGKLGIPSSILNKASHLTDSELYAIRKHPEIACTILNPLKQLDIPLDDILYHHEHFDGSGYPEARQGEEIPIGARLIAVAEAYDCMLCSQPYRHTPLSIKEAKAELSKHAGTQFDPEIVKAFLDLKH